MRHTLELVSLLVRNFPFFTWRLGARQYEVRRKVFLAMYVNIHWYKLNVSLAKHQIFPIFSSGRKLVAWKETVSCL